MKRPTMRVVRVTVACAWLSILGAHQTVAASPAPTTNDIRWGEIVSGLQMGTSLDQTGGVVHCWLRNGETNEISFNNWCIGYWGFVSLQIRDGTNWANLGRAPAKLRFYSGIGPSASNVKRLQPQEVISNSSGFPLAERRFFRSERAANENEMYPIRIPTNLIALPPPSPPAPAPRGATFVVYLLDFDWPTNILHQRSLEARLSHSLAAVQENYDRSWASLVVHSPVFTLEGSMIQPLLDQLPDAKK